MSLQRYYQEGLELIIDSDTGEVFTTIPGYARMAGGVFPAMVERIRKRVRQVKALDKDRVKRAKLQKAVGFRSVSLIPESLIIEWIVDDNPSLARLMLKDGVRVYLHSVAGYEGKAS